MAELVRHLIALGLAEPTARIYANLLSGGARTVQELRNLGFGGAQVDEARRQLLEAELIGEGRRGGRRVLYAAEPDRAWNSKIAQLVWSSSNQLGPITRLPRTGDATVDQLRLKLESISRLATALYVPENVLPRKHQVVAPGPEMFAELKVEVISEAKEEVLSVTGVPRLPNVALIWRAITDRIAQGVHYTRITDLTELVDHGLAVVRRDIYGTGVELRIANAASLRRSFYLVDRKYLVLQDALPTGAVDWHLLRGSATRHRLKVLGYREKFERVYRESVDARYVLPVLQARGRTLLTSADNVIPSEEVRWLDDLIRYGKFSTFARRASWDSAREIGAIRRGQQYGLVALNVDGKPVPKYGLGEDLLEALRSNANAVEEVPCVTCWNPEDVCSCAS